MSINSVSDESSGKQLKPPRTQQRLSLSSVVMQACQQAGSKLTRCARNAKRLTQACFSSETDDEEPLPVNSRYIQPLPTTYTPYDINQEILSASQDICILSRAGSFTLAAQRAEQAVLSIFHHTGYSSLLPQQAISIIELWNALPHSEERITHNQETIQTWLGFWSASVWIDSASNLLVHLLSAGYVPDSHPHDGLPDGEEPPPGYNDVWLDKTLATLPDRLAIKAIGYLVRAASQTSDAKKEHLLREAVLSGYTHPLPYYELVQFLVDNEDFEQASSVFEIYKLSVQYTNSWHNMSLWPGSSQLQRNEKAHTKLYSVYRKAFRLLSANVPARINEDLPEPNALNKSIELWPEASRNRAADLLYEKATRESSIFLRIEVYKYISSAIAQHRQRWLLEGTLEEKLELLQIYNNRSETSWAHHETIEQHALMLADLGRTSEVNDLLYDYIDRPYSVYEPDERLAFLFIVTAHKLRSHGADIGIPSYSDSMDLIREIKTSGHEAILKNTLNVLRGQTSAPGQTDNTDLATIYISIAEALTKPGDKVSGQVDSLLSDKFFALQWLTFIEQLPDFIALVAPQIISLPDLTRMIQTARRHNINLERTIHEIQKLLEPLTIEQLNSLGEFRKIEELSGFRKFTMLQKLECIYRLLKAGDIYCNIFSQIKEIEEKEKAASQKTNFSLKNPSHTALYDYQARTTRGQGLCFYHALSGALATPLTTILTRMLSKLIYIRNTIQTNMNLELEWHIGLTQAEINAAGPLLDMFSSEGAGSLGLAEVNYAITSVEQVINHLENHTPLEGTAHWGTHAILNIAALTMSNEQDHPYVMFIAQLPTLNEESTAYTGPPTWVQYNSDGSMDSLDQLPTGTYPLLLNTCSMHWEYVPLAEQPNSETIEPQQTAHEPEMMSVDFSEFHNSTQFPAPPAINFVPASPEGRGLIFTE